MSDLCIPVSIYYSIFTCAEKAYTVCIHVTAGLLYFTHLFVVLPGFGFLHSASPAVFTLKKLKP